MDKETVLKRMKDICDLPLSDREAIDHKRFMELTKEFLELNEQYKKYQNEK